MIDSAAIMMGCVLGWSRSWVALLLTGNIPKPLPTGPAGHDERGRLVGFYVTNTAFCVLVYNMPKKRHSFLCLSIISNPVSSPSRFRACQPTGHGTFKRTIVYIEARLPIDCA
ncbi:hypothetical protein F5883DRAFT_74814 [Diaporthe sp. PMI_573]|nr:hypothetical protein F5883DRAFT_74814 [Diaporthaceae sp. PMI_573]